jgi:hypothetical protein
MASVPTTLPQPVRVADLALPPDIAAEAEEICRQRRATRRERAFIEDDARLRHHYAGHFIVATAGPHGLQIHAIDLETPDEVYRLKERLRTEGHRHILSLYPTPWDDADSAIVTVDPQS